MSFEPVTFSRNGELFVTIDKQNRLMLSAALRKKMALTDVMKPWISVYYDKESHRIAIQKDDLVKMAPATSKTKVDGRGYASASSVIRHAAIKADELPIRYYYDGDVSIKGDKYLSFKREEQAGN